VELVEVGVVEVVVNVEDVDREEDVNGEVEEVVEDNCTGDGDTEDVAVVEKVLSIAIVGGTEMMRP
jgi:hypothetical protein